MGAKVQWLVGPISRRVLEALDVEIDGQEVLHVERAHGDPALHEVIVSRRLQRLLRLGQPEELPLPAGKVSSMWLKRIVRIAPR